MTENKRFMVDDAGTLIDMQTRNTYDYVSDVCPLLNALNDENEQLKSENIELTVDNKELKCTNNELYQENEQLKQQVKQLQHWNKCLAEKRHQELKGDME